MEESKRKGINWIWIGVLALLTIGYSINQERIRNKQKAEQIEIQRSMEEDSKIKEQGKQMREFHEAMQKQKETSKWLDSLNQNNTH